MTKIAVDGHPGLYRDTSSGAIVNDNSYEYDSYMKQYRTIQKKSHRLDILEGNLQSLQSEINDIKSLLLQIHERTANPQAIHFTQTVE